MRLISLKADGLPALSLTFFVLLLVSSSLLAGELYQQKLIKSRASRGYDANGTAIYNYVEVDEYSDDLNPGEELGVLDIGAGIREVHNVVIVNGEVNSELNDLKIGTVRSSRRANIRTIDNKLSIDGGVNASGGESVNLGVVNMNNRQRRTTVINNRVDVDGPLRSE